MRVQRGKDLTRLKAVIGTGGAIVASPEPRSVLAAALADGSRRGCRSRRATPRLWLDRDYLVYAAGLLAECEPAAAFALARSSLTILEEEKAYG